MAATAKRFSGALAKRQPTATPVESSPGGSASRVLAVAKPQFTYRATVIRVTDADTMVLRVDAGFRVFVEAPFRLLGVNGPEKYTVNGKLAKAWTEAWCARHPELVVTTEKDPEKYGRWLGTVVGSADGEVLNQALVASGNAVAWDGKGPQTDLDGMNRAIYGTPMSVDLFVHIPPLTPIEARILHGLLAAWCNNHHHDEPLWPTVDLLRSTVGAAREVAQQAGEVAISF